VREYKACIEEYGIERSWKSFEDLPIRIRSESDTPFLLFGQILRPYEWVV
jgi:hypothetical protein